MTNRATEMWNASILSLSIVACAHPADPVPVVERVVDAPHVAVIGSSQQPAEPSLADAANWVPIDAPRYPSDLPSGVGAARGELASFTVNALAWDLVRNYHLPAMQYGDREGLLYIPVATYVVHDDDPQVDACLDAVVELVSDTLNDTKLFPPFPYAWGDDQDPVLTRFQRAELRAEGQQFEFEFGAGTRVVGSDKPALPGYLDSPPVVVMHVGAGADRQLRIEAQVIPWRQLPGDQVQVVDGRSVFDHANLDLAEAYSVQVVSSAVGLDLGSWCPDLAPPIDVIATSVQPAPAAAASTTTRVPARPSLGVHYATLDSSGDILRVARPGGPICIGDTVEPTLTAAEDGYVYVVQHSSDGTCRVIFPCGTQNNAVRGGEPFAIHYPNGSPIQVAGPPGSDVTWFHWSPTPIDPDALLADLAGGACDVKSARRALAKHSDRYRSWLTAEEAGATVPAPAELPISPSALSGAGETVEAVFPVVDCR